MVTSAFNSRPTVDESKSQAAMQLTTTLNRSSLLVGVNAVTAALESDTVGVVIIPKDDVRPFIMIQHFPTMCRWRQVPLVTLPPGSSEILRAKLGLKTLVVMALPKAHSLCDQLAALFPVDMKLSEEWMHYREAQAEMQDASRKRPPGKRTRPTRAERRAGKEKKVAKGKDNIAHV